MVSEREDPRFTRTRADVIGAVNALVRRGGWTAVTHAAVAEEAGYARSTIHRNWPDRTDLLLDAIADSDRGSHAHSATGDLAVDVTAELCGYRDALFDADAGLLMSTLVSLAEHDQRMSDARRMIVERGSDDLRTLLHDAVDDGALSEMTDIEHLIASMAGYVTYARLLLAERPSDDDIAGVVAAALEPLVTPGDS